jgi:hypothetical protein
MVVAVGDAAGREVDPVAAHEPVAPELDVGGQRGGAAVLAHRPDDRGPVDAGRAARGRVRAEVVHDHTDRADVTTFAMFVQREDQWKYWPPSMTIVWPVTKSAAGEQRNTTAPATSSGT